MKTPLEQLKEATESLRKDNEARAKILAKPLATIANLAAAAKINVNGPFDKRNAQKRSRYIRNIIMNGN